MSKLPFLIKTAYRDSRKNRGKLFLFMSSIILGIAALVAINSFNYNLIEDIDDQSKTLLGADLSATSNKVPNDSLLQVLNTLPGEKASMTELFSMAYFPKNGENQFVRIKGVEGAFPFYGQLNVEPKDAANSYQTDGAIVDNGLMLDQSLELGDTIRLGTTKYPIVGKLMSDFGSIALGSSFAPTVYIGKPTLESTGLVQLGSMLDYSYYFKTPKDFNTDEWEEANKKQFRNNSIRLTTIQEQRENLDEAFSSLNSFLNLIALVSLILGCIGVASSVFIYIKSKISSIAVFRCIGMSGREAFLIYFFQIIGLGILSVIIGAALGATIQVYLPILFKDVLPYEVNMDISWRAIIEGVTIGSVVTSLFALVPLLAVRLISPLRTLRSSFEDEATPKDPLKWAVYMGIFISLFIFLFSLTKDWIASISLLVGLVIAFALLFVVSKGIMWAVKKFFPTKWSFVFRQGLSNLYRPNNQTSTLIVSLGLGTSILTTLFIIQGLLLNNVDSMDAGDQPNMILYGIETQQKPQLATIAKKHDMPLVQEVPIVTMRLAGWKGRSKEEWLLDSTRTASRWAINREARVSYRDYLEDDETLIKGDFKGMINPGDSIFISLADNYARSLDVDLGDELTWNVQGAIIKTYVGSIREIEFRSMRTRFFILFPNGVLENAPQFHVLVTKATDNIKMSNFRREVVKSLPNVSVVDLASILSTLNSILSKISYIIKFMAGFSILTGLIVLISSLLLSKYQRVKESVLLRTIGASRMQILKINATEYSILGALSAATGIGIALVAAYLITTQELELDFDIQWLPILLIFLFVVGLTTAIGLWNSRDVINKSPLEVLRKDS